MIPWDASGVAQSRIVYKGSASIHVDLPILLCCRGSFPPQPPRLCFTAGGFINENFFLAATNFNAWRRRLERDPSKLVFFINATVQYSYTGLCYQNRAW